MKIKIKKIVINNFKNIKNLEITLGDENNLKGGNGCSKTSISDAFYWGMVSTDSLNRKNFILKTLDKEGKEIHGLSHSVRIHLLVNEEEIVFEKTLKEKWTKRKGESQKIFTGHSISYFVDEIPVSAEGYKKRISEIINEELLKQLSNPRYFTTLNWVDQRAVVGKIVGDVSVDEVILSNPRLIYLKELLKKYEVLDYRKQLKVKRDKSNEELKTIPPRIDECNNQIVFENFPTLRLRKEYLVMEVSKVKYERDKNEGYKRAEELSSELYSLKEEIRNRELEGLENPVLKEEKLKLIKLNGEKDECTFKIKNTEGKLTLLKNSHEESKNSLEDYKKTQEKLRERWVLENSKVYDFSPEDRACPTCYRVYDEEILAKLMKNGERVFEDRKDKLLKKISLEGKKVSERIRELEKRVKKQEREIYLIEMELGTLKQTCKKIDIEIEDTDIKIANYEYKGKNFDGREELSKRVEVLKEEIDGLLSSSTSGEVELSSLENELKEVERKLLIEERNESLRDRIFELQEKERILSEELLHLEKVDGLCEEFIRERVKILEKRLNGKFKNISFKLFKEQINGSVAECCECTSNGVPFSNLNTAAQINCGLEIINAISNHHNIYAPIFIDNRECVNEIVDVDTQIINLIVTKEESLRIESFNKDDKKERVLDF